MKRTHKMLLTGGVMVAVLLPAGTAMAATSTPVCDGTGQHQMLRDGTGAGPNWSATAPGRPAVSGTAKVKAPYGKQDGSGPLHSVRPLNGTGRQLGLGRA